MNTVHDLGGMQNFGAVTPEADEPTFHHPWERRVFGVVLAMGGARLWNLDQSRFARESMAPAEYLSSSYYRIWYAGLAKLLVERGLASNAEIADGHVRVPGLKIPVLTADRVPAAMAHPGSTLRAKTSPARFALGDLVRTKNLHPRSHTRLPRYCRDKAGKIAAIHGAHVFPDAHALGQGEDPQWLYGVRFEASELWGGDTSAAAVYVDCWEPYLAPRGKR